MASLHTCRNFCHNFSLASKDELAGKAFTKDSGTNTPILVIFYFFTPTFALVLASLRDLYTNVNLQKAIKLAFKLFV